MSPLSHYIARIARALYDGAMLAREVMDEIPVPDPREEGGEEEPCNSPATSS